MEIIVCFIVIFGYAAWRSWLNHKENIERIRKGKEDYGHD